MSIQSYRTPAPMQSPRRRSSSNGVIVLLLASIGLGATCDARQTARGALDVAEAACILFHEEIEDEAGLARACGIADALIPELRKLISARKSAKAQRAAMAKPSASPSASASGSK